jgi:hypothetical protein
MTAEFVALIFGGLGTLIGALIQFFIQRASLASQERREIVESYLLQLQNSLESLYYRLNNIRVRGGEAVMGGEYYRDTNLYVFGRILAHEHLFVTKRIFAKLNYDNRMKREIKLGLHTINWAMNAQSFHHYYRVQLAEMLIDGERVLSFTEFLDRKKDRRFQKALKAAGAFIQAMPGDRIDEIMNASRALIAVVEARTNVPSATSLLRGSRRRQ